jgi:hypothetical protein
MKIRLIVPQTGGGRSIDAIAAYGLSIARISGGFTAHNATGRWIDNRLVDSDGFEDSLGEPANKLIVEPVTVFDCSCTVARGIEGAFRDLAKRIGAELKQDCVYLEVDGVVELVKP